MARLDQMPFQIDIQDLGYDGRGVARRPVAAPLRSAAPVRADPAAAASDGGDGTPSVTPSAAPADAGKTVFVADALAGERVVARLTARARRFDQAQALEVLRASPHRVEPRCPHFGVCSGCVLQHLEASQQVVAKQRVLTDNLQRVGHVTPGEVLPPIVDAAWGYRRKGRFSVRRVEKKDKTLVGFRERDPRFVADLSVCHTVVPGIAALIPVLSALVDGLDARSDIPQIEFIAGDPTPDFGGIALVFRHLQPLSAGDRATLVAFAQAHGIAVFLQPAGVESVHALWPQDPPLAFRLAPWDVELRFRPLDFIQVNAGLNERMIERTLALLDVQPGDRVLDLFCGLGNFTLPLARRAREVVGVEGDIGLVARARDNARHNAIDNAHFHAADLTLDLSAQPWMADGFDSLLLDPPRSGADQVLRQLPLDDLQRIVYVSCHPASLARDAGYLVNERGWRLVSAGVMDMFPQTAHVESIALFER